MRNTTNSHYKMSQHVRWYELADGQYAVWNSFFPKVLVIDRTCLEGLQALAFETPQWFWALAPSLRRHRLIYRGSADPYASQFFQTADRTLAAMDLEANQFYTDRLPYETLYVVNSGCNLGCSYCVSYYGDEFRKPGAAVADRGEAREKAVLDVVDQYLRRKRDHGHVQAAIAFNGGEILLRWPLVRKILQHATNLFPEITPIVSMNTNATLLTKDIADVLAGYEAKISVSVDGYKEAHDGTRHYHGGGGSFERVMAGISNYREATGRPETLRGFQGTIEDIDRFESDKLFAMSALGFEGARLAPNLLTKDSERGVRAALWEAQLTVESQTQPVTMGSTHFERALKRLNIVKGFRSNCGGLSGLRTRGVVLNIDSMQLSHLCSFSSPASVPLAQLEYDIFNPALWQVTRAYIGQRVDMLRTACQGCDVLGSCQGSCVYNALDVANKLNPAGCAYQRAMFRHAIDYRHSAVVRPLDPAAIQHSDAVRGSSGISPCSDTTPPTCGGGNQSAASQPPRVWTLTQV